MMKTVNKNSGKVSEAPIQDTVIGASTSISGDIVGEKSLRIEGRITGNVIAEEKIVVGETGYIKGGLKAESVVLYGHVQGNIETSGLLEIMVRGHLEGDIKVDRLVIQEGGIFSGNSNMGIQEDKNIAL